MPRFEWDEAKRQSNLAKHGLDFADLAELDWDTATIVEDTRRDYGERRFRAFLALRGTYLTAVFAQRNDVLRIISFRKANWKEIRRYVET